VHDHRRIDILRRVPTLAGWRLSEASGWGQPSIPDLEAAVLCEAAAQADTTAAATELLQLAVLLCPTHVPALVALADVELKRVEGPPAPAAASATGPRPADAAVPAPFYATVGTDCPPPSAATVARGWDSLAEVYAWRAVRARALDPEAWYVLGRAHRVHGDTAAARGAFTAAAACLRGQPLRPFATVLADPLVRPWNA